MLEKIKKEKPFNTAFENIFETLCHLWKEKIAVMKSKLLLDLIERGLSYCSIWDLFTSKNQKYDPPNCSSYKGLLIKSQKAKVFQIQQMKWLTFPKCKIYFRLSDINLLRKAKLQPILHLHFTPWLNLKLHQLMPRQFFKSKNVFETELG